MITVTINNQQEALAVDIPKIEEVVKKAIRSEDEAANCALSITLCSDQEMRQLNSQYRGQDKATNVLAFPLLEGEFCEFSGSLLGDIIVSTETVISEAPAWDVSVEEHFYFLLVHGVLHLLGYDHGDEAEYERMEKRIFEILATDGA